MIVDLKNKKINRIKQYEEIQLDFSNKLCTVLSDNLKFDLDLDLININITKNIFFVKYNISSDCFEVEIKII